MALSNEGSNMCPECSDGKHKNCDGTTWSNDLDRLVPCDCTPTDNHQQPK